MSTTAKTVSFITVVVLIAAILLLPQLFKGKKEGELVAGFDSEFLERPDGYPGLCEAYNFKFPSKPKHMDPGLMYKALENGAVDVICGFSTDGRIPAYNLFMLEDDKNFFPPYYAAPLVRVETLNKYPELSGCLEKLGGILSDKSMSKLNYEVDEEKRPAAEVARKFLLSKDLLKEEPEPAGNKEAVSIGGKNFTEQQILGEIMAQMIENHTDIPVNRRLNLGGTMICFNALQAGDLDLYAEYTGTALMSILGHKTINDAEEVYRVVSEAFQEKYNLKWLEQFGFNNTFTLTMRKANAKKLGLESISDLASYIRKQKEENGKGADKGADSQNPGEESDTGSKPNKGQF